MLRCASADAVVSACCGRLEQAAHVNDGLHINTNALLVTSFLECCWVQSWVLCCCLSVESPVIILNGKNHCSLVCRLFVQKVCVEFLYYPGLPTKVWCLHTQSVPKQCWITWKEEQSRYQTLLVYYDHVATVKVTTDMLT